MTFASATSHLGGRRPSLEHAVAVSSTAAFVSAVSAARAGEVIHVLRGVWIPGEFTGFDRVVPGGSVDVVFDRGSGFTGMAGPHLPAVWLKDAGGWRIWGGTITNADGNGILVYAMPGPLVWTGFRVSRTADTCVAVYPIGGDIARLTLDGVAGTATPNLAYDPHPEQGTGIHAWNIGDAAGGLVTNSTFAADVVNQATGAAVEIDTGQIGPAVTVYARARRLGFPVPGTAWNGDATQQVAGNVIQLWGGTPAGSLRIAYAEGSHIAGRILETDGVDAGADLSRVTLERGRISGPILLNRALSRIAYAVRNGLRLGTVSAAG